jgi:hypothetical protein
MQTYLFGYGTPPARLPLHEMAKRPTWSKLDAEFRRRLVALFDAAKDAGTDLGIGGGWRSSAVQRATFLDRHTVVTSGGCCVFEGKRYALKPRTAHAAPPGRSYHEEAQDDGDALAADLIGDLVWMNRNCQRFGLVHFGGVNREPWHVQPIEVPTGRPRYDGAELVAWRPDGEVDPPKPEPVPTPTEDDMPIVTNAEPFFGAAIGVAKFLVEPSSAPGRRSRLKLLSPEEWRARGSLPGTPLSNADIGALGVDAPA